MPLRLRPMQVEDLPGCTDVFYAALDELYARHARPPVPRNAEPLIRLFAHLLETDPERCHVAEAGSMLVGFGIAHRRDRNWFLSFLFIRPGHQSVGLGRQLALRCLAEGDAPQPPAEGIAAVRAARAVCAESSQPVSLALYASLGMRPRVPIFLVSGKLRSADPMGGAAALEATSFARLAASDQQTLAAAVDGIDLATLGYEHPQDHRFLAQSGRQGWLFHDPLTRRTVGYGYAQPSGRVGPVATTEAGWLRPALAHLFRAVTPSDGWQLYVPGPSPVLAALLKEGFRLDSDAPILWCATSAGPAFERYLPGSYAVL